MPDEEPRAAPGAAGADVAGIVLAAGTSSRMGTNKLLLELGGETLLRRTVRAALAGGLSPVLVVLGHEAERARRELDGLACRTVINPDHAQGITSSLQAGVAAIAAIGETAAATAPTATLAARPAPDASRLAPDAARLSPDAAGHTTDAAAPATGTAPPIARVPAALVLLADMPFVSAEMIAALVARYRATGARLVISDYEGVTAPPMLYDRSLFGELLTMTGGRCGKQVVKRHRAEAEVLSWPAAALADLDAPGDYERLQAGPASRSY
jgi:molybdenum cofactor cytidylyltransferase